MIPKTRDRSPSSASTVDSFRDRDERMALVSDICAGF